MKTHLLRAQRPLQRGFTMIEVLIALLIVAVGLSAAIRAIGMVANNEDALRQRLLADWSADSVLSNLRLTASWPELGTTTLPCPQGDLVLTCILAVSNTPDPGFRQVEISVVRDQDHVRLAQLVSVIGHAAPRPL